MIANYATKGELTAVNTTLGTQIEQNAAQISSTASKVQDIEIDSTQAKMMRRMQWRQHLLPKKRLQKLRTNIHSLSSRRMLQMNSFAAAKEAVEEAQKAATEAGDAAAAAQSAADSLADRITTVESNITQTAEQITAAVSRYR
ncbi:MAG: hypothetical protein ACLRYB_18185 [Segatella copri]